MSIRERILLAVLAAGISVPALADDAATPQFAKGPGAIVTGLSGLVTGTAPQLAIDRSNDRANIIRGALTTQLLTASPTTQKLTLGTLTAGGHEYVLSNALVLCRSRGKHAVIAADASYLGTVTSSLNKFATPPKIETIADALGSVFQNYSISTPPATTRQESAAKVEKQCADDVNAWPAFSYGRTLGGGAASFAVIGDITTGLNAVATLYNAIVAMLTPIIVTPAKEYDAQQRAAAITNFFINYRTTLLNAAQTLADSGSALAKASRLEALGQYSEAMASLRSTSIDISNVAQCAKATQSPLLNTIQSDNQSYYIPNDNFVICYAEAWKQIADQVKAVLTAADQYDKFADASDDGLQNAVKQIRDNIDHINDVGPSAELNAVLEGAGKLIAYGQTVSQALSQDNLKKAQTSINDLMKLIGSK